MKQELSARTTQSWTALPESGTRQGEEVYRGARQPWSFPAQLALPQVARFVDSLQLGAASRFCLSFHAKATHRRRLSMAISGWLRTHLRVISLPELPVGLAETFSEPRCTLRLFLPCPPSLPFSLPRDQTHTSV